MNFLQTLSEEENAYIIAEIGNNHQGSLDMALKMSEEAILCGVDAIKFQAHVAEHESSNQEKFRVKFSNKYKNRFDYWKKTSFNKKQWRQLSHKILSSLFHVLFWRYLPLVDYV